MEGNLCPPLFLSLHNSTRLLVKVTVSKACPESEHTAPLVLETRTRARPISLPFPLSAIWIAREGGRQEAVCAVRRPSVRPARHSN